MRLNKIINVQRNSINTVQHNQIWAGEKMTGGRALAGGAESSFDRVRCVKLRIDKNAIREGKTQRLTPLGDRFTDAKWSASREIKR